MARIDEYLRLALKEHASDLLFGAHAPAYLRVDGTLFAVNEKPHPPEMLKDLLYEILSPAEETRLEEKQSVQKGYCLNGEGFFRAHFYWSREGLGVAIRVLPQILPLENLSISESIRSYLTGAKGLLLVSGASGSGKTTTLASFVDFMNRETSRHIMTLEEPVEFIFENKKSLISQREVGTHCQSVTQGLKQAMHQNCDVIVVGELRDAVSMRWAVAAAQAGHLVIAGVTAGNGTQAMHKVAESVSSAFPGEAFSENLLAVCHVHLQPNSSGSGRTLAFEILSPSSQGAKPVSPVKLSVENPYNVAEPTETELWGMPPTLPTLPAKPPIAVHFPPPLPEVPVESAPVPPQEEPSELDNEIEALQRMIEIVSREPAKPSTPIRTEQPGDDWDFAAAANDEVDYNEFDKPMVPQPPTIPAPVEPKKPESQNPIDHADEVLEMTNTREVKTPPAGLVPPPPLPGHSAPPTGPMTVRTPPPLPAKKEDTPPVAFSSQAHDEEDEATVAATGITKREGSNIFKSRPDKRK